MKDCIHEDGFLVVPANFSKELLRAWSGTRIFCQHCGAPVYYRQGQWVTPHFAHVAKSNCDSGEPETPEHLEGKRVLRTWMEHLYPQNVTHQEVYINEIKQRADITTIFPDGHKLCIEYQSSPVSENLLRKRIEGYEKANISQVWIFGEELFKTRWTNRFRLHACEKIIWKRQGVLYRLNSLVTHPAITFMNIASIKGKKTIVFCKDKFYSEIQKLKLLPDGRITMKDGSPAQEHKQENMIHVFSPSKQRLSFQTIRRNAEQLKLRREEDFLINPLRNFAIARIGDHLSHPLFNQKITGDELFLIDHRLWQSYLFLTEIHKVYQRKSVFGKGIQKPKLIINHILIKDHRFPERPFQTVLKRYIDHQFVMDLHTQNHEGQGVKMIHELVYEYFCRLVNLGFLKNLTPKQAQISAGGKMFGQFEVLFDQFLPNVFGSTESELKTFFQRHQLRYLKNTWFDIRLNKKL
ncbi:competence protein [Brevibacillus antibioticus]|uniref:Competence protein n=1 Tax=Brevibacillus antibioticus TaxID=2570228 RepID=A0A4U2Y9I1_9BACL|nr:competence protein CoiA family protein [Brevibacillus antibioticus]TKI56885.1 competence protein [Brevibacillus antibioticus]